MSKYDPLRDYLRAQPGKEFTLTFKEIEDVLGFPLPASAERPQWWANQVSGARPQRDAWRSAGFEAFLSGICRVRFSRA